MDAREIALLVSEIDSFTPCSNAAELEHMFNLVRRIVDFATLHFTKVQVKKVILSMTLSAEWHKGQYRWNKTTPYIIHPLEVADFGINSGGITYKKLVASILHDNVEDEDNSRRRTVMRKKIREVFGYAIADIVKLLTKHRHPALRARFFITLREEKNLSHKASAIEIKFWDRILNASTFNIFPPEECQRKIKETLREFPVLATELSKTLQKLETKGHLGKHTDRFTAGKLMQMLSQELEKHL